MDFIKAYEDFRSFAGEAREAGRSTGRHAVAESRRIFGELVTESGMQGHMKTFAFEGGHQLRRGAAQARRQGDMLSAILYTKGAEIAHGIMQKAGHAQRQFENVAKVRRGDMSGMSDSDLRAVIEDGHKWAKPDENHDDLRKAAHEERLRRVQMANKAREDYRRSTGAAVTKEEKDARAAQKAQAMKDRQEARKAQIEQQNKAKKKRKAQAKVESQQRRESMLQRQQQMHEQKMGHMEDRMRRKAALKAELRQSRTAATSQNKLSGAQVNAAVRANAPKPRTPATTKPGLNVRMGGQQPAGMGGGSGHTMQTTKQPVQHSLQKGKFGGQFYTQGGHRVYVATPATRGRGRKGRKAMR